MLRLDSIKLKCPSSAIVDYLPNEYTHTQKSKGSALVSDLLVSDNLDFGINRISIDNKADNIIIEASAKALKSDYAEGINLNTYGQLIDNINKTKVIELDADIVYNNAELLRCDVTDNLQIDCNGRDVYSELALMPLSAKYETTQYKQVRNEGIVLKGKQKSFKERQIFYNKLKDLSHNKKGRDFLNSINKTKVFNDFKGTTRVESNFTQLRKIREYIGSNQLTDVLGSDAKVNHDVFKKITKQADTEVLFLFSQYEGMKLRSIIELEGIKGIIENANNNWAYIDAFLRNKSPHNYRRIRKKFREVFNELQVKSNNTDTTIINLVLDALSKVA